QLQDKQLNNFLASLRFQCLNGSSAHQESEVQVSSKVIVLEIDVFFVHHLTQKSVCHSQSLRILDLTIQHGFRIHNYNRHLEGNLLANDHNLLKASHNHLQKKRSDHPFVLPFYVILSLFRVNVEKLQAFLPKSFVQNQMSYVVINSQFEHL